MYKQMPEYYEPYDLVKRYTDFHIEMSREEGAVLCGLIKEHCPKKIVEVGVSAGGSTCLILKCLEILGFSETSMISVDLNEKWYKDAGKETGYLVEKNREKFRDISKHKFLLGKHTVERLQEIGDQIDFLFLDTVHSLPGELLDFLLLFPYLSPSAVVVLHDTNFHNIYMPRYISNRVLLNSVVAEKYYTAEWSFLNIGAFRITKETQKNIEDVFASLLLPWAYEEKAEVLQEYRQEYKKHYSSTCLSIWDNALECAEKRFLIIDKDLIIEEEENKIKKFYEKDNKVFIYGCGFRGTRLFNYLKDREYEVAGMIVSDGVDTKAFEQKFHNRIYHFSELELKADECIILLAVGAPEVKELLDNSVYNYFEPNQNFFSLI